MNQEFDSGLLIGVLIYFYFLVRWTMGYLAGGLNGAAEPAESRPVLEGPGCTGPALLLQGSDGRCGLAAPLSELKKQDPSFDEEQFLQGAVRAYESIVAAFTAGDLEALAQGVSAEVHAELAADIAARAEHGATTPALVKIRSAAVTAVSGNEHATSITVRFIGQYLAAPPGPAADDPDRSDANLTDTVEEWTFVRAPRSADPNWTLTATRSS